MLGEDVPTLLTGGPKKSRSCCWQSLGKSERGKKGSGLVEWAGCVYGLYFGKPLLLDFFPAHRGAPQQVGLFPSVLQTNSYLLCLMMSLIVYRQVASLGS